MASSKDERGFFGDKATVLLRERKRLGLSSSELARRARMSAPDVSRIERGRLLPYRDQAEKLALAVGWGGVLEGLFADAAEDAEALYGIER